MWMVEVDISIEPNRLNNQLFLKIESEKEMYMISTLSERILKKWRKEALVGVNADYLEETYIESRKRILLLTQELLDNHLINQNKFEEKPK